MKKKMISILLCAALGITTLAGCGGASGGTTVASEPAAAVAEESKESAAPESTEAAESQESTVAAEAAVDGGGEILNVLCHSSWRTDEANAVFDYVAEKCNVKFEFEEVPEGSSGN